MILELRQCKINFLGDSITAGAGTSAPDKTFCGVIEIKYGAVCRNYGIGGTRIARQQHKTDICYDSEDFCSRFCKMEQDADAVVVFGGTNDFGHGDAPLGTMADRTPDTFYGALHTLYSGLTEKYPRSAIAVVTPLHRVGEDNPRGDGSKPEDGALLKTYVEIIREVAEYYSLPILDLYKESGLQPNVPIIRKMYIPDGLHPNDEGHIILADKIARFIERL